MANRFAVLGSNDQEDEEGYKPVKDTKTQQTKAPK